MIESEFLFTLVLEVDPAQNFGATPVGFRRIVVVTGGQFEGPKLRGVVRSGGSDWLIQRPDDSWQLNVRLVLETDDGAMIGMTYKALRHGPAEVMARHDRGEVVDSAEYYFRSAPTFETASAEYVWLNGIIGIGLGKRTPQGPTYDVYQVL